jgi:hypothetical protein
MEAFLVLFFGPVDVAGVDLLERAADGGVEEKSVSCVCRGARGLEGVAKWIELPADFGLFADNDGEAAKG